ncbi:endonuclease [Vibrio parahaemolyticus]|uniref:endonuclease/exonuclease/phosphatase family protein n=1 Tax=Vibrio parahaemolyticus TaxID=670 RepID=UPI0011227DAF|nr:endonuclease [Vibrio parahaemolyticus]
MRVSSVFKWVILLLPALIWLAVRQIEHIWWAENLTSIPALIVFTYVVLASAFFIARRWLQSVFSTFVAILFVLLLVPPQRSHVASCSQSLSVIQFNLFYENSDINQFINYLLRHPADLVVMQELTPRVGSLLHMLDDVYPHYYGGQRDVGYPSNLMILSRHPITEVSVYRAPNGQEVIRAVWLPKGQAPITLFAAHPPSPRTSELWHQRNALVRTIETLTALYPEPEVLVVGDFNLSSVSPRFSTLFPSFQTAPVTSWPTNIKGIYVPEPMMIGIDHLWLKSEQGQRIICSRESSALPQGSDHRMVTTQIGVHIP